MKNILRALVVFSFRPVMRLLDVALSKSAFVRKIFFETQSVDFLVSNGPEKFVTSTQDQIGRLAFCQNELELEKFFRAHDLIDLGVQERVFVDVGANLGTICIPLLHRRVFTKAVAIEPEPRNLKLLKANLILNGVDDQTSVVPCAMGYEVGVLELELSQRNYGDHRIRTGDTDGLYGEANREIIEVEVSTLDIVLDRLGHDHVFLWVDTQGYEGFVLQGAKRTMERKCPLVIEFWPYGMRRAASYAALKQVLIESPYSHFFNLSDANMRPNDLTEESLDDLYSSLGEGGAHTDLYFA